MQWIDTLVWGFCFSVVGGLSGCSYDFPLESDSNSDSQTELDTQSYKDTAGTDTTDIKCSDEDGAPSVPRSCLDILTCDPAAMDGEFEIDPDGTGGAAPFAVTCDLSGGGWTLIYTEDFSLGDSSGWKGIAGIKTPVDTTSSCKSAYSEMLGGYAILGGDGAFTAQTFSLRSIPHTEVAVRLDYVVLDSWDAERALVYIDGTERYSAVFNGDDAIADVCGGIRTDLGPQSVAIQTEHLAATVTVNVTSTLDQAAIDESFGVDNVDLRIR